MHEVFKMIRKLTFLFLLLIAIGCIDRQLASAMGEGIQRGEAIIHQASYQEEEFILTLEMDKNVYQARFIEELPYEDYLYFHHNEGAFVMIQYSFESQDTILIHHWSIEK